jgi:hypothetical protein
MLLNSVTLKLKVVEFDHFKKKNKTLTMANLPQLKITGIQKSDRTICHYQ